MPSRMSFSEVSNSVAPKRVMTAARMKRPAWSTSSRPRTMPGPRQAGLGRLTGEPVAPEFDRRQRESSVVHRVAVVHAEARVQLGQGGDRSGQPDQANMADQRREVRHRRPGAVEFLVDHRLGRGGARVQ